MRSRGDLGAFEGDHQGFHRDAQIARDCTDARGGPMSAAQQNVANMRAAVLSARRDHAERGQFALWADKLAEDALSAG